MRIATAMRGLHYVLHAPQGDTYADLLFTMIERRQNAPPVTYTTFQARDLGGDTAELFKTAARDAYERFRPQAHDRRRVMHRRTDSGRSRRSGARARPAGPGHPARASGLPEEGELGRSGDLLSARPSLRRVTAGTNGRSQSGYDGSCNVLGPAALGFRHRDDVRAISVLLERLGVGIKSSRHSARPRPISRVSAMLISSGP